MKEEGDKEESWLPHILLLVIACAFTFGGAWIGGIVLILSAAFYGWDKRHDGPFPTGKD